MRAFAVTIAFVCLCSPAAATVVVEDGGGGIVAMRDDGSDPRRIATGVAPSLSPDGRLVAYVDPRRSTRRVVPIRGGRSRAVSSSIPAMNVAPGEPTRYAPARWSPEGRRFVEARAGALVVTSLRTGDDTLDTRSGEVTSAVFSPDGRRVAYSVFDGWDRTILRVLRLRDGRDRAVGEGGPVAWTATGLVSGFTSWSRYGDPTRHILNLRFPSGRSRRIAYGHEEIAAVDAGRSTLLVAIGGQPAVIDLRTGATRRVPASYDRLLALSRDGTEFLALRAGVVLRVPVAGGEAREVARGAVAADWSR